MTFYGDDYTKREPLPEHDTAASIQFLKKFAPAGPWVLISIIPDGGTDTHTFSRDDWKQASEWIEARQGKQNIYFHVNPMLRALTNKAAKTDVKSLDWLYVDIDPRVGDDFDAERTRILDLLSSIAKKPTLIVDSGGGFQGFWRLLPCGFLQINGVLTKAQELEAYNIQLEREYGGDHCHNVDRVMRLPGTINLPNLKKRQKGRKPALAKVVEWNNVQYAIEEFTAAPYVQTDLGLGVGALSGGRPKVVIPGNVADIGCEELQTWAKNNNKAISDHCLALIATGTDPIDPTKYQSRSEALFRVCCDLVRAEVPEEMIFAVITGSNGIAESVRDKPNWESYALRQIERAKEEAIDPVLRQLNEKHAVISDIGGKCRIISEIYDVGLKRTRVSKQSFEDFRNRYRHIKVSLGVTKEGVPITKPAGAFWIDHPNRRQFDTIIFAPGKEVDDAYNLWKGFGCNSLPGSKHESFLLHIRDNICSGNPEHYEYLLNWLAHTTQHPDSPGEVAVVMRGKRGTGKSFFASQFGRLWGRHYMPISNSKHLVGNFNAHLRDTVVIFGDEAFFAGDRAHEGVLKTLITETTMIVEGKGLDAEMAPNFTHLLLASNESWVVPAGLDERRFFVLEVGEENKQNHTYFGKILQDLDDGGLENLLYFLLTRNVRDFNLRRVPQTAALMEQKILSMSAETEWFYNLLWEGRLLSTDTEWAERVAVESLYADYLRRMDQQRRPYRLSPTSFGRFIASVCPKGWPTKQREVMDIPIENRYGDELMVSRRPYVYRFPRLEDIRTWWDRYQGGPFDWPKVEQAKLPMPQDPVPPF